MEKGVMRSPIIISGSAKFLYFVSQWIFPVAMTEMKKYVKKISLGKGRLDNVCWAILAWNVFSLTLRQCKNSSHKHNDLHDSREKYLHER